jgi:hypothetical protein
MILSGSVGGDSRRRGGDAAMVVGGSRCGLGLGSQPASGGWGPVFLLLEKVGVQNVYVHARVIFFKINSKI